MRTRRTFTISALILLAIVSVAGCGKDSDRPRYKEIEGRITSIDLDTGEVTILTYSVKEGKDTAFPGKLAPDAEILIDGATARLEDLRKDDAVKASIRVEKRDGERHRIATKVEVTRKPPADSAPATGPADN